MNESNNFHTYGCEGLDRLQPRGAFPGGLTLLTSTTAMGKSMFCLNLVNSLLKQNIPCLLLVHMGVDTSLENLTCIDKGITLKDLREKIPGEPNRYKFTQPLLDTRKSLAHNNNFLISDFYIHARKEHAAFSMTCRRLREFIKYLKKRSGQDYMVVFLDHIDDLKDFYGDDYGTIRAEELMMTLKQIAIDEGVHIIGTEGAAYSDETLRDANPMTKNPALAHPQLDDLPYPVMGDLSDAVFGMLLLKYWYDNMGINGMGLVDLHQPTYFYGKLRNYEGSSRESFYNKVPENLEVEIVKGGSGTQVYRFIGPERRFIPVVDPYVSTLDLERRAREALSIHQEN